LEDKAKELALTSKYKSEFLANMSHELRTPLNSILVLGQQLSDNPDGNLTAKQVEFARTIHGAGTDLLNLITDILDFPRSNRARSRSRRRKSSSPACSMIVETSVPPRSGKPAARFRGADRSALASQPGHRFQTSAAGVQELLSNAFKFTEQGGVRLSVSLAKSGGARSSDSEQNPLRCCFEVADTGIGIPQEKQRIIFEAFQQADAGTSRKYGGTGLGLAISRELASLLGGEIQLRSAPGRAARLRFTCRRPTSGTVCTTSGDGSGGTDSSPIRFPVQLIVRRRIGAPGRAHRRRPGQSAARRCHRC
jgi:signal transduction histidine kinase